MPVGSGSGGGSGSGASGVRAGAAFVELFLEDNKLVRGLAKAHAKLKSFGSALLKVGTAVGGAGAVALSPLKFAIDGLGELGNMGAIASALGLSAEKASSLFGILAAGGSDLRDATEGIATFNQRISDALEGKGEEAAELFKKLGVGAEQFANLDAADRIYAMLDIIRQLPPEVDKVGVLMKAVGEDTGKNMASLVDMSADQMARLGAQFRVSSADMRKAKEASAAYTLATAGIGRVWQEVMISVAPTLKELFELVAKNVQSVSAWLAANREVIVTGVTVAVALVAIGGALIGLGAALSGAGVVLGVVIGAFKLLVAGIGLLLTPIGLVVGALAGLTAVWLTQSEVGKQAASELGDAFRSVGSIFGETWEGVVNAVKGGDLALAFKIAGVGVKAIWYEMLAALGKAFGQWIEDNRTRLVALGSLLGAIKGGKLGSRFGPWGTALGALGGGVVGGVGTNQVADLLAGFADNPALAAKAESLKAELAALAKQAAALPAGQGGPAKDGLSPSLARLNQQVTNQPFDAVKGSFQTYGTAAMQFGYADSTAKRQEKLLERVAKATEENVKATEGINEELKVK